MVQGHRQRLTHFDSVEAYGTERELGVAVKESVVAREKLLITTKVQNNRRDIPAALENNTSLSLKHIESCHSYQVTEPRKLGRIRLRETLGAHAAALTKTLTPGVEVSIGRMSESYQNNVDSRI